MLFELALEDLAGVVARELVDEHDLARDLVVREVVLDVALDLVLAEVRVLAQHDERLQPLSELVVVDADRGRLLDRLVRSEQLLDLGREHVLPA